MALLEFTEKGIYCPQADVFIDPWRPVKRALITHGHADHARSGHKHYLCTRPAWPVMRYRLGPIKAEAVAYGEPVMIDGVRFSFHPAGHIVGSAQIRIEYKGEIWVVSGDYKLENDQLSTPFEPVKCHTFITESTFGLPVYNWQQQYFIYKAINDWWRQNKADGKTSVITGYALGKAQRILQGLNPSLGTIYTHGAIENINEVIRQQGINLQPTVRITPGIKRSVFPGNIVIATPGTVGTAWMCRFNNPCVASASGWVSNSDTRSRKAVDHGFVLSDHADWKALNQAVKETGAERVFVTHGYKKAFSRWLKKQGLDVDIIQTEFEGELSERGKG